MTALGASRCPLLPGRGPLEAEIEVRNKALETMALEGHPLRLPGLVGTLFFYYKHVTNRRYGVTLHGHDHWEITRISRGRARYCVDGHSPIVRPDRTQYLVIPPRRMHQWQLEHGPLLLHSYQLMLKPVEAFGEKMLKRLAATMEEQHFVMPTSSIQDQAEQMLWGVTDRGYPRDLLATMVSGCIQATLTDLLARLHMWDQEIEATSLATAKGRKVVTSRIVAFIEENLGHPLTLSHLETHFHYSARHLNRLFRSQFGLPLGHYLRQRRMEIAEQLLATTEKPIKEIAFSLGYRGLAQFGRYFSDRHGLTPTAFRARKRSTRKIQAPTMST